MEDFYQSIIIRNPISSFHLISAFSSATGLRQHLKRHTTCKLAVAKMPGTFSLYNLPKMEKHIQSPPIPTESSLYNIQGNTSIKDPPLQYYKAQQTSAVDDNFNPGKGDTGIIAHVDDSELFFLRHMADIGQPISKNGATCSSCLLLPCLASS